VLAAVLAASLEAEIVDARNIVAFGFALAAQA
jgi:hypothetical protein